MTSLRSSTKSYTRRVTKHNPVSVDALNSIQNKNLRNIIQLIIRKNKTIQMIHKINSYLEQAFELEYFRELKSILNQTDYFIVIDKLRAEYRTQGSIIIQKRRRNDHYYIILDGSVLILDEMEIENKFEVINTLQTGKCFGEASLLSIKREATARVQAMTDCILLTIDYQTFLKIASKITLTKKQEILNTLINSSLFYGIDKSCLKDLLVEIQECKYGLNNVIYSPGSDHDSVYFIKTGIVEISKNNVKLMTLVSGQNFGIESQNINQATDSFRCQQAKSKSNGVVVYKIGFGRLKILQGEYDLFLSNAKRDFINKSQISEKLMTNYNNIKKLATFHKAKTPSCKKRFLLRKKIRNKTAQKIPQWWGTVNRPLEENVRNRQFSQKENTRADGLLGAKRISELKRTIQKRLSEPDDAVKYSARLPLGELKSTFGKKTMTKIRSGENEVNEVIKNKIVPKIKKDRLVNYAKSSVNCWDLTW